MSILDSFFGLANRGVLSALKSKVAEINRLEEGIKKLKDSELKAKTEFFREQFKKADGDLKTEQAIANDLLPEAFAVMRETMWRVWGERHFDVQLMGGIVLHEGKISEMKTGEGKTIVATLALYLNALSGRGAHLVTVNDYLSRRDGEGMGSVYDFLGLTTGIIQSNQISYKFKNNFKYDHYSQCDDKNLEACSRSEAYACDITYGTNNEFGFDYLRDNMAPALEYCSQRELSYAIVDEVDSILIDEARTPLIISAPAEESAAMYQQFAGLVPRLKVEEDYAIDEKDKVVTLTDAGIKKMEQLLGVKNIYEDKGITLVHHLEQALKAQTLFKRDKDYIVKEGEILIVDEFTGRLMVGRRYSEGLHQAIEAKEGVEVKKESQTMATISFQNLFRLYNKLAGMTGTAATEAEEFFKIYQLDVVEIPTNKEIVRKDFPDRIYKDTEAKYNAIVAEIKEKQDQGQPVLVGTVSVEKNEILSRLMKKAGVKHEVLNAKNHAREAKIIMKAGLAGSVTVATNMAGRGTDIKLSPEVKALGGLHVLGTERHEARRIDNQLRGRSGRQGDPGSSTFYVSMDDDLMRIFGGERMKKLMGSLGLPDDVPIENKMISRSIESAQRRVEGHNFDIRKHLVEYDDVMNKHREVIYRKRRRILESASDKVAASEIREEILNIIKDEAESIARLDSVDHAVQISEIQSLLNINASQLDDFSKLGEIIEAIYNEREKQFGPEVARNVERAVYLRTIDMLWVEHLTTMDELRTGIGLRGYGQRDPLVEYKQEAYNMFQNLLRNIESSVAKTIFRVNVQVNKPVEAPKPLQYEAPDPDQVGTFDNEAAGDEPQNGAGPVANQNVGVTTVIRQGGKTVYDRMQSGGGEHAQMKTNKKAGRNDPCPCGSGKKYKKCCGK